MYLAIDLGTTACKTVAYSEDGTALCEYNREYPLIVRGDAVLQDANEWWEQIKSGIREVTHRSGINKVDGISVSTQGISVVPTDENGDPIAEAVSWLDMRPAAECQSLVDRFGKDAVFRITGKFASPSYTLPQLMRMKREDPVTFDRARYFLLPLDFVNMKLTGIPAADYTIAGGTMAYDLARRSWSRDLLDFAGVPEEKLPQIGCMGDFVGKILPAVADDLGITGEMKVFLGGQDQKLAAIGAGIEDGVMTVSIGTATAVTRLLDSLPDSPDFSVFPFNNEAYSAEGVVPTSGSALKWVSQNLFGGLSYRDLDRIAEEAGSSDGVRFSPDFTTDAAISGMTLKTTPGNIIYALYEGVSNEIASFVTKMGGAKALKVFGGGSKSDIWCRILADCAGIPVMTCDSPETASRGAAVIASEFRIPSASVKRTYIPEK